MITILFCWFLFFAVLALRNEYEPDSKNYKQINIIVWIFGFLGPGLTALITLVTIYYCIFPKASKRVPLLDLHQKNIPTAIRIDSPTTNYRAIVE